MYYITCLHITITPLRSNNTQLIQHHPKPHRHPRPSKTRHLQRELLTRRPRIRALVRKPPAHLLPRPLTLSHGSLQPQEPRLAHVGKLEVRKEIAVVGPAEDAAGGGELRDAVGEGERVGCAGGEFEGEELVEARAAGSGWGGDCVGLSVGVKKGVSGGVGWEGERRGGLQAAGAFQTAVFDEGSLRGGDGGHLPAVPLGKRGRVGGRNGQPPAAAVGPGDDGAVVLEAAVAEEVVGDAAAATAGLALGAGGGRVALDGEGFGLGDERVREVGQRRDGELLPQRFDGDVVRRAHVDEARLALDHAALAPQDGDVLGSDEVNELAHGGGEEDGCKDELGAEGKCRPGCNGRLDPQRREERRQPPDQQLHARQPAEVLADDVEVLEDAVAADALVDDGLGRRAAPELHGRHVLAHARVHVALARDVRVGAGDRVEGELGDWVERRQRRAAPVDEARVGCEGAVRFERWENRALDEIGCALDSGGGGWWRGVVRNDGLAAGGWKDV